MKHQNSQQMHSANQKISAQENLASSQTDLVRKVTRNGNVLTMKKMKLKADDTVIPANIVRELAITSELNSPYIIHPPLSDIHYEPQDQSISYLYEYGAVDLKKVQMMYINKKTTINDISIKSIIFQILLGLDYMHSRGISHCNLTPAHLLIMPQSSETPGVLRFINFSLARVSDTLSKVKPSTAINIGYRAPEIIIGAPDYGYPADIWAAGCVLAELLLQGKPLFNGANNMEILQNITKIVGTPKPEDLTTFEHSKKYPLFGVKTISLKAALPKFATPEFIDLTAVIACIPCCNDLS